MKLLTIGTTEDFNSLASNYKLMRKERSNPYTIGLVTPFAIQKSKRGWKMNNQKKEKTKEIIKYVGVTMGFLIMILAIFLSLKIEIINFLLLLILIDLILVIWKMILDGDYKK